MADVFVSYSNKNKKIASLVANALVNSGISVWWDNELPVGSKYRETIKKELDKATVILVLWSEASISSSWVLDEADYAVKSGRFLPACLDSAEIPLGFRQHQTYDLRNWNGSPHDGVFTELFRNLVQSTNEQREIDSVPMGKLISIAQSPLYVVRAITLTWGLEKTLLKNGYEPSNISYPWNDKVLDDVANGKVDIAVYNTTRVSSYRDKNPTAVLHTIRAAGHSMGGKNFAVLAHTNSSWTHLTLDDFVKRVGSAVIGVPKKSDMFSTLKRILETSVHSDKIKIVDVPVTMGLEFFNLQPEGLLITGQNVRHAGLVNGDCLEVLGYDDLADTMKVDLLAASQNSIVVSHRLFENMGEKNINDMCDSAWNKFMTHWSYPDLYEKSIGDLIQDQYFWSFQEDDMRNAAKIILYETYRFGQPV